MLAMKKLDHEEERSKVMLYLYVHARSPGELTYTKISGEFQYAAPTFNRIIYFLIGAGLVKKEMVGHTAVFMLTTEGFMKMEKERLLLEQQAREEGKCL